MTTETSRGQFFTNSYLLPSQLYSSIDWGRGRELDGIVAIHSTPTLASIQVVPIPRHFGGGGQRTWVEGFRMRLQSNRRSSIRSLIAASLGAPNMTVVMLPVSKRQLDDVVEYDIAPMPTNTGKDVNVVVVDFNRIEGGLDQTLSAEQALNLISGMLVQGLSTIGITLPININEVRTQLQNKIEELFAGKSVITLKALEQHIRNVKIGRSFTKYGAWNDQGRTTNTRFITAVLGWIYGGDWVKANCAFAKTQVERPKYAVAIYGYDVTQLAQTERASAAIPMATPTSICVLGFYPNAQGGYDVRYVGTMPTRPMVSDQSTAAPMFIRHDAGAIATRKLIDVISTGWGKADELFQNPDGAGSFTFTEELLAMSRRNPTGFMSTVGIAVAHTNGHKNVVKDLRTKRAALASATSDLQEVLARDYSTAPAASGFERAFSTTPNRSTPFAPQSEQLVGAGVPSYGAAFGTPASSFEGGNNAH